MDEKLLEDKTVLLTIQNSKKADQMIHLVYDGAREQFITDGLTHLFKTKEICIASQDIVESLQDYAQVLSFLLETMSTAKELGLPYGFQNEFKYGDTLYSIYENGECRVLKKAG